MSTKDSSGKVLFGRRLVPNMDKTPTGKPGVMFRTDKACNVRYGFVYRDEHGRQKYKTVGSSLADAVKAKRDYEHAKDQGDAVAPNRTRFDAFAREWLDFQAHVRPRTRAGYESALRYHLLPRFGHMKLQKMTVRDILSWLSDLRTGKILKTPRGYMMSGARPRYEKYAEGTIASLYNVLKLILDDAERQRAIPRNPMRELPRGARPTGGERNNTALEIEEVKAMLRAAYEPDHGRTIEQRAMQRAMLATAVFSGLRIGELLGLTWNHVDLERCDVRVEQQRIDRFEVSDRLKNGERGKRTVNMLPEIGPVLIEWRRMSKGKDDDFVFPTSPGNARRILRRALARAGIEREGIVFHSLRHTFVSLLIAQGHDVSYAAKQLGDKINQVWDTYYHPLQDDEKVQAARASMSAQFGALLETGLEPSDGTVVPLHRKRHAA